MPKKTALLLVNLGTPDAPTQKALRPYLSEFLSDPRVVELPRFLWLPLLHGIILRTRPKKSAEKYAHIWTAEGSPLLVHTRALAQKMAAMTADELQVLYAMRYGNPSMASVLNHLHLTGIRNIILLPLYPQYAASTTASVMDKLCAWLSQQRDQPEIHTVRSFCDHPAYIRAAADHLNAFWNKLAQEGKDKGFLLLSFHGLPKRMIEKGDPYQKECETTARLLAKALGLSQKDYAITYQSRFGGGKWLAPSTEETLVSLAKEGIQTINVFAPGFLSDCLETLEEIGIAAKARFIAAGGRDFRCVPALNDSEALAKALLKIAMTAPFFL